MWLKRGRLHARPRAAWGQWSWKRRQLAAEHNTECACERKGLPRTSDFWEPLVSALRFFPLEIFPPAARRLARAEGHRLAHCIDHGCKHRGAEAGEDQAVCQR